MYQGGFRPHESRKIRFGDCEIISKNDKTACLIQIDENTKTGRRECSINSNTFLIQSFVALIFVLIGFRIGEYLRGFVNQHTFRNCVLVAFIILGSRLIYEGVI